MSKERILPNQEFNNHLYKGGGNFMADLSKILLDHDVSHKFTLQAHHRVSTEDMSTSPIQLALLKFLIDLTGTRRFLEIGTFVGNTTMNVVKFIGVSAEVVTIEKFEEFAAIAHKNFVDNDVYKHIELMRGDAVEKMAELPDASFDMIYIDGDKGRYLELAKLAEKKIAPDGLIVIDDIFFHGDVLQKPTTDKGAGCKKVIDYYKNSKEFSTYLLPIHNGIMLLKRMG